MKNELKSQVNYLQFVACTLDAVKQKKELRRTGHHSNKQKPI